MDSNRSQNEKVEEILADVDRDIVENTYIMERTTYMMTLYQTLSLLKEGVGGMVDQYYKLSPRKEKPVISFMDGEAGEALFILFQSVFKVLKSSPDYYGSEYRTINGIKLEEINGIDISQLGIPTIVPANLTQDNPNIAVSLRDLDTLRIAEFENIAAMAAGDSVKIGNVKTVIDGMGGINLEPLFPKEQS